jgi:hypothetical protein
VGREGLPKCILVLHRTYVYCVVLCLNQTMTSQVPAGCNQRMSVTSPTQNSAASTPYCNHNVSNKLFVIVRKDHLVLIFAAHLSISIRCPCAIRA